MVMRNEFTAIIERDGKWFVAWCPEVPGANGQGRTAAAAKKDLAAAIKLVLADRRRDALRGLPAAASREVLTVA
jgi:predicted RNase H-like HicB family nuclease